MRHPRSSVPSSATAGLRCLITLATLGLTVAACTPTVRTHGHRLDPDGLAQIQPGRTSRDQVAQLLGSPSSLSTFDDSAWYYVSQRTEQRSFYQENVVEQKVVTITFDQAGRVASVDELGLKEARAVAPVERTTPTAGNDLSVFEQFVGNIGRFNLPRDQRQRPGDY
jgi:outer membrane protein assembly factor BamE (lipoprotein component of BamABCDE complex)